MMKLEMPKQKALAVVLLATIYFAPGVLYLTAAGGAGGEPDPSAAASPLAPAAGPFPEAARVAAIKTPATSTAAGESDRVSGCPYS